VSTIDPVAVVVTVTATVMDGTVVRWHRNTAAAEDCRAELASASRNGVLVRGYLHELPPGVLVAAERVHERLSADRRADFRYLATHRRDGLAGPLVPVREGSPS
jgi:hypothetical protein